MSANSAAQPGAEGPLESGWSSDSVRSGILEYLLAADGAFVSGERLSERAGMTRTAVWKHIKALQDIGFTIDSSRKLGYCLLEAPDLLLGPLLSRALHPTSRLGRKVHWLPSVSSTNAVAMDLARRGADDGTLVSAWEQTGGRGRRGRVWFSPKGGLWMSIVLQRPLALARAAELTLLCSVAVRRAVTDTCKIVPSIKWPNDLLVEGRKVCGILAEIRADGESVQHAVLGVGLNSDIPADLFPPDIAGQATSLAAASGHRVSNVTLAAAILKHFEPLYTELAEGKGGFRSVADEWRAACVTIGRHVRVQTGSSELSGEALGVDDHGAMLLRQDTGGVVSVHSGDVLF